MHDQQRRMQEQERNQQLMRDGEDEDDQPGNQMMEQDDEPRERHQFQDDGKSKLVQEAKAMMRDDDEDDAKPAVDENAGPKIKMGKIGKKKRTNAKAEAGAKSGLTAMDIGKTASSGHDEIESRGEGFSENDIEFMRQAIQILCRSTNPLGKSIDFVTDDVDSMSKEFEHWRKEAINCN